MDAAEFRRIMSQYPTGVTVVTVSHDGVDRGLTVNSLVSVSLAPPSILISIGHESESLPLLRRARRFVVNILSAHQEAVARRFALKPLPPEPFLDLPTGRSPGGALILTEAVAWLEAAVVQTVEAFDHTLFIATIGAGGLGAGGPALTYHRSQYGRL